VLFLTDADVWFGEEHLLPMQPTVLLLAVVAPFLAQIFLSFAANPRCRASLMRLVAANVSAIVAFGLLALVSLLMALYPTANWQDGGIFIYIISYDFVVFLIGMLLVLLPSVRKIFLICVYVSLITLCCTVLYDLVEPGYFSREISRAAGFGGNANYAAILVVALLAVCLRYDRVRFADHCLLVFCGVTVFATLSRGGLILFMLLFVIHSHVSMVASRLTLNRRLLFFTMAGLAGMTVIVTTQLLMGSSKMFDEYGARDRLALFSGQGHLYDADESRIALAQEFMRLVDDSPLLGHGTGFTNFYDQGPHNMYLQQWVNNGVAGLLCYIAYLACCLRLFRRRRFIPGQVFTFLLCVASFFSHNIIDNRPLLLLMGAMLTLSLPYSFGGGSGVEARGSMTPEWEPAG
jgi:O-antigen ligase